MIFSPTDSMSRPAAAWQRMRASRRRLLEAGVIAAQMNARWKIFKSHFMVSGH